MKALLRWFSSFTFTFFTTAVVCVAQTSANCTYQTFQYPGASHTTANGINQWGTIVGQVDDLAVSNEFGFIRYSNGQSQQITMPGAVSTRLFRRNAGGASVGTYIDSRGQGHGLLLSGGKFSTIDYPGASTELRGINKWGTIVGFYINSSGHAVGFKRWTNGSFSIIQFPGQSDTFPSAIGDSGVIVGWVGAGAPPGGARGFVLANGKYLYVDDPNSTARQTVLYDMNANGVIVGTGWNSAVGGAQPHGFQIVNGKFEYLSVPGALWEYANGINGSGVMSAAQHSRLATLKELTKVSLHIVSNRERCFGRKSPAYRNVSCRKSTLCFLRWGFGD